MADDDRGTEEPGWAAPHLPPRDPADERTAAAGTSGGDAPAAPPPAPPAGGPPPSAAWAQAVTPGPPPVPPGPGSVRRKRRGWLITLIAVLGVFALAVGFGTALFVSRSLPPLDAAHDFVDDLAEGQFRQAADRLCAADQDDTDGALSVVTRRFPGNDEIAVNPLSVDRDGSRATVDVTVSPRGSDSGDGDTFELPLREEGGDWKPCPGDTLR